LYCALRTHAIGVVGAVLVIAQVVGKIAEDLK
jgi:hypothetical protein